MKLLIMLSLIFSASVFSNESYESPKQVYKNKMLELFNHKQGPFQVFEHTYNSLTHCDRHAALGATDGATEGIGHGIGGVNFHSVNSKLGGLLYQDAKVTISNHQELIKEKSVQDYSLWVLPLELEMAFSKESPPYLLEGFSFYFEKTLKKNLALEFPKSGFPSIRKVLYGNNKSNISYSINLLKTRIKQFFPRLSKNEDFKSCFVQAVKGDKKPMRNFEVYTEFETKLISCLSKNYYIVSDLNNLYVGKIEELPASMDVGLTCVREDKEVGLLGYFVDPSPYDLASNAKTKFELSDCKIGREKSNPMNRKGDKPIAAAINWELLNPTITCPDVKNRRCNFFNSTEKGVSYLYNQKAISLAEDLGLKVIYMENKDSLKDLLYLYYMQY